MNFVFVDYSSSLRKESTPAPENPSGKFIQIRNGKTEYIVFSVPEISSYHANIAERFLSEKGVKGAYNKKRDFYKIDDHEWEIIGGGTWSMDEARKVLKLYGLSQAYGRFDSAGLTNRLSSIEEFSGLTVQID